MVPGQVGANGGSAARHVEEVGGGEIESVHLLCMRGGLVMGNHLRLVAAEMMDAVVRNHNFFGGQCPNRGESHHKTNCSAVACH